NALPPPVQAGIVAKHIRVYTIDASRVAAAAGVGKRVNTVLQACFFALSGVLPRDAAIAAIKRTAQKTYGAKGDAVVQANYQAIDAALDALREIAVGPPGLTAGPPGAVNCDNAPEDVPEFVQRVTLPIIGGHGNDLPVSAMPVDGTYPTGTAK